jgi:uncharacterized protein
MLKRSQIIYRMLICCLGIIFLTLTGLQNGYCLEVPALKGRVNDYGNILSAATETQLDQFLQQLEQTDSTQIAVLTIPSLDGESLEGFSLKVVENWKIGQAEIDNGALLLVAVSDRKIRIEVGYGLEGSLTDLQAGRIIRNVILPQFKQGNFDQGIIDGVSAMIQTVKGEYTPSKSHSGKKRDDPFGYLAMLIFFFFFIGNALRKNKIASALVGGTVVPLFGTFILGFSLPLLFVLILFGVVFGLIASKMHMVSGRSGRSGRSGYIHTGGFGSSSSGGFGGFSGGGGGFGGGGASGGW